MITTNILRKILCTTLTVVVLLSIVNCSTTPKKIITELYEPKYDAQYSYLPKQSQSSPSGYNVGIIDPEVTKDINTDSAYGFFYKAVEKEYDDKFKTAFSNGLEKILMSKGVTVSGPFKSYSDMTYPERSRCSFIIEPKVRFVVKQDISFGEAAALLDDYEGPNGESNYTYFKNGFTLTISAEMEYVILDPLTHEKLERHTIKMDPISKKNNTLRIKFNRNRDDYNYYPLHYHDSSNYFNEEALLGKITDDLYASLMSKVDKLTSIEELAHLKKYKDELKEKKRY